MRVPYRHINKSQPKETLDKLPKLPLYSSVLMMPLLVLVCAHVRGKIHAVYCRTKAREKWFWAACARARGSRIIGAVGYYREGETVLDKDARVE